MMATVSRPHSDFTRSGCAARLGSSPGSSPSSPLSGARALALMGSQLLECVSRLASALVAQGGV